MYIDDFATGRLCVGGVQNGHLASLFALQPLKQVAERLIGNPCPGGQILFVAGIEKIGIQTVADDAVAISRHGEETSADAQPT